MAGRARSKGVRKALEAEMMELQRRMAEVEKREEQRLGRLATEAGLTRLELDEATVLEEFKKIALRFQDPADTAGGQPPKRGRKAGANGSNRKGGAEPGGGEQEPRGSVGNPEPEASDGPRADQALVA